MIEPEVLDLVDSEDCVVGTMLKSAIHAEGRRNFRGIHAFIRNAAGELGIPRRSANQKIARLALDASVSGHVKSGETYEDGLKREASEELRIDSDAYSYRKIGYFTPHEHGVYCFETVYEIDSDETPDYNREDIVTGYWLTPQAIRNLIAKGEPVKSDFPILFQLLYQNE